MGKMERYEEYVKKYADNNGISEVEARTHCMTKEFWKYLKEEDVNECVNQNQIKKSTTIIACGVAENCES